jgi:hypothetical protein
MVMQVHLGGGMDRLSRDAADSLAALAKRLADCLMDDGRFVRDVMTSCPEALPLTELLRRAHAMSRSHASQWRTLAGEFRTFADRRSGQGQARASPSP